MGEVVTLRVDVLTHTKFTWYDDAPGDVSWTTDDVGGQALAEFAGRACYESWDKPNASTATNAGYLAHILDVRHMSVLEHGVASLYLRGISRSLTHELVRHRHFSYSQLSQRYVNSADADRVTPPELVGDDFAESILERAWEAAITAHDDLYEHLMDKLRDADVSKTERRKRARQAARCVLPNMTETRIVVTGNYRAWRHFVAMRAAAPADVEIRALAVECLRQLQAVEPNVFQDFTIGRLSDGTEHAHTDNGEEDR